MKTKEEIIRALRGSKIVMINTGNPRNAEYIQHAINYIESMPKIHEEISTLNPMKIDEERLNKWNISKYGEPFHPLSDMKKAVDYYNSTLEDHQVLQPLPSEMPELFGGSIDKRFYITDTVTMDDLYQEIRNHYGTPTKKELVSTEAPIWYTKDTIHTFLRKNNYSNDISNELSQLWADDLQRAFTKGWDKCNEYKKELVSVEELDEEICALHRVIMPATSKLIAQHIIDTYSLNPPKREWWDDLKENDIFMMAGVKHTFSHIERRPLLYYKENVNNSFFADLCTPYIEPSIHDKFMASLSDEQKKLYDEMKEVKGGM